MKKFYGKEEKRIEKLEPKVEIPPELKKKQREKIKDKRKNPWESKYQKILTITYGV